MKSLTPRVLILGGTGFVGRHVCEKLTRLGCSMTVITRRASQAKSDDEIGRFSITGALILYLDFINLFLYLLRLFGKRRD